MLLASANVPEKPAIAGMGSVVPIPRGIVVATETGADELGVGVGVGDEPIGGGCETALDEQPIYALAKTSALVEPQIHRFVISNPPPAVRGGRYGSDLSRELFENTVPDGHS